MVKKKMSDEDKMLLRKQIESLEKLEKKLNPNKKFDELDEVKKIMDTEIEEEELTEDEETEPEPEQEDQTMSYLEALTIAVQMEADAIEHGLLLIELAPEGDAKNLIEIVNDENDHSVIYNKILRRIKKRGQDI